MPEITSESTRILREKSGKRHRQIEAQSHVPVAVILEAVDDFPHLRLVVHLAEQDLRVLESGSIDRHEAVGAVNLAGLLQHSDVRTAQPCEEGTQLLHVSTFS